MATGRAGRPRKKHEMSQIFQSSYSQRPSEAVPGMFSDAFAGRDVDSKVARGILKAGYGCFKSQAHGGAGTTMLDAGEVYQIPSPAAAVDVDAIIATIGTTTGVQTLSGASLDGVVGGAEMQPARILNVTFSSHADWDATTGVLTYVNDSGVTVSENISIPNGGNATVLSTGYCASFVSFVIPAQSGTGGTATLGVSALTALTIADFRGTVVRQPVKTTLNAASIFGYVGNPSVLVTGDYVDGETVPVMTEGGIWVYAEEAMSDGDPVYIRIATGSASALGGFRNDADSASCVLVPGAKCKRDSTGAGPAWVHFAY